MDDHSNGDNGISTKAEWFLKRCGDYIEDLIIDLDKDEIVIGRGNNKHLKRSPGVSRKHAFFKKTNNNHWLVEDLCSTNGIYINRKKIAANHLEPIKESDIIGLGVACATSNDQFSFILCRRAVCKLINGYVEKELSASDSSKGCPKLEHDRICEFDQNETDKDTLEANASKETSHLNNYTAGVSGSSDVKPAESNKDSFDLSKLEHSLNLSCKVLLERCDENNDCFANSLQKNLNDSHGVNTENDCKKDAQELAVDISLKIVLEDSDDDDDDDVQFLKTKCKRNLKQIILSDDTNSSDDDIAIIPPKNYKFHRRKSVILSDESDSCDEVLLETAIPAKTDNTHHAEPANNLKIIKEENIYNTHDSKSKERCCQIEIENKHSTEYRVQLTENESVGMAICSSKHNDIEQDQKLKYVCVEKEENQESSNNTYDVKSRESCHLEVENRHFTDCDAQLTENKSAVIAGHSPESIDVKQDPELKYPCVEKEKSTQLHFALDSVTVSDKVNECNGKSITDDCALAEFMEKQSLNETSTIKSTPGVSKSDDVLLLDDDDDDNFGYSQNDDIIIISDDEDSPEVNHEENEFLNVKKEHGIDEGDVTFKTEQKNNEVPCTSQKCEMSVIQENHDYGHFNDEEMPLCDTVDDMFDYDDDGNIDNHVHCLDEKELLLRISWPPSPDANEKVTTENDFFPNLSQSFFSDDSSSSTSSDAVTKNVCNEFESTKSEADDADAAPSRSKSLNKCHSSIQPIEALPMHYRPKGTRGREEWFTDRTTGDAHLTDNGITISNTEAPSETSKRKFYGNNIDKKLPPKIGGSITGKKKKGITLKQRLKENMGHRVRCPGGGSAIVKQDTTCGVRNLSTGNAKRNTQWSQCISKTAKQLPSAAKNVYSSKQKDAPHNVPVVQRFPSRTEQLTKSMLVNTGKSSCDNRKQNCLEQNVRQKQNAPSSCKWNSNKNQKRENPFGNFRIPKKKKVTEEGQMPLNETNSSNSPEKKRKHPDKCKQVVPESSDIKQLSKGTNGAVNGMIKDKTILRKNDQNPKNKRVRFAEQLVSTERKAVLPLPNSANVNKHSLLRNNSCALNVPTDPVSSCTRNYFPQESIIAKIVCWNTNWLREQHIVKQPPPVANLRLLKKVTWQYYSADDHWNTYFNLLLLEIWQSVYQSWKESESKCMDHFVVVSLQQFNDMMILKCQTAVPNTRHRAITYMEGHLAIVELVLRTKNDATAVVTTFGYLCDCRMERYRIESAHPLLKSIPTHTANSFNLVNFVLKVKCLQDNIKLSKLMKMKPIFYLKSFLRQCEALQVIYDCSLQRCILLPQHRLCSLDDVSRGTLRSTSVYNDKQKHAILGVASAMLSKPIEPRLLLLHGPPGTGKTHTIVGIIQELLFHQVKNANHQVKLLVTAPSNAAVDEIGRRLLKLRSIMIASNGKKMRIVRVGQPNMVHKDLKMYYIDELLKLNLQNPNVGHDPEITANHLQAKINMLQLEISSRQEHNQYDSSIVRKQKELECAMKEFQMCKSQTGRQGFISEKEKFKLKIDILAKADIILSTLNSCRQSILEAAFGINSSVSFTCCIIDEATQCTEPEVLIPFYYRMNKVLLVGDPQQLPATVLSKSAAEYGFQISLFERLTNFFSGSLGKNPVFMLTDQYRMHPEICTYPSSYFYSGQLKSHGIGNNFINFPLKRYVILDIMDSQESTDNPNKIYNSAEANFVEFLCSEMLRLIPSNCTLGVITPYQGQKQIINKYFQSTMSQEQHRLEVNTVDGFQGRECDVIILSCVRAGGSGSIGFLDDCQRLNVAITRARYSLIICGHMASLRNHKHWGSLIRNAESRNLIFPVTSSSLDAVYDILKA